MHSYENVGRPEEAIAHGRIYAAAAPGVAHAQHMLAHVLPRVGKWTEALEQFQKADRIEEEYAKEEKLRPGDDWHHAHNLDLLGYTQLRLGRIDEAEKTFRRRWEVPAHRPLFVGFNTSWPEFLLLRGRFDEALAAASVLAGPPTPSGRTAGFALSAEALLALGRVPEATAAIKRAEEAVAEGGRPKTTGGVLFGQVFGRHVRLVAAEIDLGAPNAADAEQRLIVVSDELASSRHVDALGNLFVLERTAAEMRRTGRDGLGATITEKMRKIDPEYRAAAAATAGHH